MSSEDIHSQAISWLKNFHKHMDALDASIAIPKLFAEDCTVSFAGQPPLTGQAEILDFFNTQFPTLELMQHTIKHVDVLPDRIYQEANIRYIIKNDPEKKEIDIKGIAIFGKKPDEDKLRFFTVYLDPSPIKERAEAVFGSKA
ncbi:hypothetical protein BGW36DRAFT_463524 [Talaromyces proteolyticus]|uniref:SnoaL-like domain-containing protein n=1 Tax=Talaromyces proteolyticus TaxID=1131652 RepID=A0AAD4PTT7_9EURO|nr:uncharacterized protein BGW36DRAFT_463524 [Talaromyces proteolyticus]KAH8693893.1 hypothetical protein BGW36DRAFT_463524 [Talaromyces proteolyticus]